MEQKERISLMEQHLDQVNEAVKQLSAAIEKYADALPALRALHEYYKSEEWKKDFADDEQGLLPPELKRGVLSEDGIYNALDDNLNLRLRINKVVTESFSYFDD